MKNSILWRPAAFLAMGCCLLALLLFPSCTAEHPSADLQEAPQVWSDKDPVQHVPKGDCEGEIPFFPTLTVMSVDGYPGYDLALHVSGSALSELPPGCQCSSTVICLDLLLDIPDVLLVGVAEVGNPSKDVDVVYENPIGFSPDYLKPLGHNDMPENLTPVNPQPFSLCVEELSGNLLLFDFVGTLPNGTDLSAIVNTAGGICIVDNIDNPNG